MHVSVCKAIYIAPSHIVKRLLNLTRRSRKALIRSLHVHLYIRGAQPFVAKGRRVLVLVSSRVKHKFLACNNKLLLLGNDFSHN